MEADDIGILTSLATDHWIPVDEFLAQNALALEKVESLVAMGLVLTDRDTPQDQGFLELEQSYRAMQWHPDAVIFHAMSRWAGSSGGATQDIREMSSRAQELAQAYVDRVGPPPPAFVHFKGRESAVQLPFETPTGGLYETLSARRTDRTFDVEATLDLAPLGVLMKYTFGVFGQASLAPDVKLLHKTSPSGGSLHPIEAFPLVLNVEGMSPGLYHYDVEDHAFVPQVRMGTEEARQFARDLAGGQLFVGDAQLVVVLVARFFRNQWKYRKVARTYSVLMTDAGHLSQVFYLTATELGLGVFYTAAFEPNMAEEALGLNPAEYGAIGLCGCGARCLDEEDLRQGGLAFDPMGPSD